MLKKSSLIILAVFLLSSLSACPAFSASPAAEYLCEFGVTLYKMGRQEEALSEFKKALMVDPSNKTAQNYVNKIFAPSASPKPAPAVKQDAPAEGKIIEPLKKKPTRDEAMDNAFAQLGSWPEESPGEASEGEGWKVAGINISGEAQARLGQTSTHAYWKRANWDLNEKNWRIMSSAALDNKENTYDPRIYDRLRVNFDTDNDIGFGLHANLTVDPWSFTGKSSKFTINGDNWGDAAEIQLKYWSNTGYTLNESINTLLYGDAFTTPEIKIFKGATPTAIIISTPQGNQFTIPANTKIIRNFLPVREFVMDYKQDNLALKVFPAAYENQSLTFDDPLRLSNNRTWWENSPWLDAWTPGNYNSNVSPSPDYTSGLWDNTLSFSIRDSEGQRLTSLRGFTFEFLPQEGTTFTTSLASPRGFWQDYSDIDNALTASRITHKLTDGLKIGATATGRWGLDIEENNKLDAKNYVVATDTEYEIINGIKASAEIAYSRSKYDMTSSTYNIKDTGYAYHFSLQGRFPFASIMNTKYGYDGIAPGKEERFFTKFRFLAARMDQSFDESLSSYVETRDDEWWSRHLHFRTPFKYYYQGEGQLMNWNDVKNFGIGNGLDVGRSVLGLRVESSLWDSRVENLFDVRNVHGSNTNKFIENVARDELKWDITDKLTSKMLGIYQRLPRTKGGFDPFIFDPQTGEYFTNDVIEDGLNPSIYTGSLGLEYRFFDWLALNGIWENTNDISLAYDNFPRGVFNTAERSFITIDEYNNRYREIMNVLYNQAYFPKPPYPAYNIFKAGLRFNPMEKLELYLDYTRNPFSKAGQVDDNMNHVGFELGYKPLPKLSVFFKYSYSRWQDLDRIIQNDNKIYGHHNFFGEFVYRKSEDEDFTLQYGEASRNPYMGGVLDIGWDPYGGSLRTIDTQHIWRLYYRRKF